MVANISPNDSIARLLLCAQNELAEASKAEVKAEELRAAGKDPGKLGKASSVHNGDRGNVDQGLAKKEREKSMHRMTRKKRRRLMAQEAAEKAAEQEAEELRAKGEHYVRLDLVITYLAVSS